MVRLAPALALALMLCACERQEPVREPEGIDVGAQFPNADFQLTDHTGRERRLADFRGRLVVLFFGFTQCPDVCPTTLTEMAAVMRRLGDSADRVQVLFVTIDPERDTRELLAQYVPAFDARFIGLRGDAQATARVTKDFKVFVQKIPGRERGSYTLDHTAYAFVFDANGALRLKLPHGQGADAYLRVLRELMEG